MNEHNPTLLVRLWLAWVCFIRVLVDAVFAGQVMRLGRAAPKLPDGSKYAANPPEKAPRFVETSAESPLARQPESASAEAALQLLSVLQREGRFIDFVQQDITSFQDADVGAAARVVQQGCKKALDSLGSIVAIRDEAEGTRVILEAGFAHGAVKLVGNVQGAPPYRGTLRHKGWRAESFELPRLVGDQEPYILAPAEIEL